MIMDLLFKACANEIKTSGASVTPEKISGNLGQPSHDCKWENMGAEGKEGK